MSKHVSYLDGSGNITTLDGASRIATAIYSRSGVVNFAAGDFKVTQRGLGANNSVDIAMGQAVIGRDAYAEPAQSSYFFVFTDAIENLEIPSNSSGQNRIDAIVAYVNTPAAGPDDNEDALVFQVVQGTPSGSPSAPSSSNIQSSLGAGVRWIRLADVDVDNGFSTIVNADITDRREDTGARSRAGVIRSYISNVTWNKPNNLAYIIVEVIGAGGGGGGAQGDTSKAAAGGGGGAGGYARKLIPASELSSSESIAVGTGGAGGFGTNTGGAGGTTSFGSHLSATGGAGGVGSSSSSGIVYGGAGGGAGLGSGGNFNFYGGEGFYGLRLSPDFALSGQGGGSYLGGGARAVTSSVGTQTGRNGLAQGSGGSGAAASDTTSGATGGSGASGRVIITEFY